MRFNIPIIKVLYLRYSGNKVPMDESIQFRGSQSDVTSLCKDPININDCRNSAHTTTPTFMLTSQQRPICQSVLFVHSVIWDTSTFPISTAPIETPAYLKLSLCKGQKMLVIDWSVGPLELQDRVRYRPD